MESADPGLLVLRQTGDVGWFGDGTRGGFDEVDVGLFLGVCDGGGDGTCGEAGGEGVVGGDCGGGGDEGVVVCDEFLVALGGG